MKGRRNVRQPAGPVEGAGGSRLEAPVGLLAGTGVGHSKAGSPLW